eukprot:scaffold94341_cov17-Tisochrysis_lutea.AAC.1
MQSRSAARQELIILCRPDFKSAPEQAVENDSLRVERRSTDKKVEELKGQLEAALKAHEATLHQLETAKFFLQTPAHCLTLPWQGFQIIEWLLSKSLHSPWGCHAHSKAIKPLTLFSSHERCALL